MVGQDLIENLEEESMKPSRWIACTTWRIFPEKPYLYYLVVDLSPSLLAHSPVTKPTATPDEKPVLSLSQSQPPRLHPPSQPPPSPTCSIRHAQHPETCEYSQTSHVYYTPKRAVHTNTSTPSARQWVNDFCLWLRRRTRSRRGLGRMGQMGSRMFFAHSRNNNHQRTFDLVSHSRALISPRPWAACHRQPSIVRGAGMNDGPCSSGLNGHGRTDSEDESLSGSVSVANGGGGSTGGIRLWIDPWKIYGDVCMFCSGICSWIGLTPFRRQQNNNNIHLEGPDEALTQQPRPRPAPTTHLSAEEEEGACVGVDDDFPQMRGVFTRAVGRYSRHVRLASSITTKN